jgi:hypothetical protein
MRSGVSLVPGALLQRRVNDVMRVTVALAA